MNKSKKLKHTIHIKGQVIRYKDGRVAIVANNRPIYNEIYYIIDAIDIVIDKTTHPVWSLIKYKSLVNHQ